MMGNGRRLQQRQGVVLALTLAVAGLAAWLALGPRPLVGAASNLSTAESERILASVVQIELYARPPDGIAGANGKTRYLMGRGQGVLVRGNGRTWLVTHNH